MSQLNQVRSSSLFGANTEYLEQQFETFQKSPESLPVVWRQYFEQLPATHTGISESIMSDVRESAQANFSKGSSQTPSANLEAVNKQIHVINLINAFRLRGHEQAQIDPLNLKQKPEIREINPAEYGLTDQDLSLKFNAGALCASPTASLHEILTRLENVYCSTVGSEFMHIPDTTQKQWIQKQLEQLGGKPSLPNETRKWILDRLTAAEGLERYLHTKYTGQKRFSLEGGESLIVSLNALVALAGKSEVKETILGMAHRGRLNVLVNVFGKKPADLFSEFEGTKTSDLLMGDVKYHQGFSSDVQTPSGSMHMALAFNPSHLEIVAPVVEGSVRARQDRRSDKEGSQVLPIVIHGDAAFAGQGVVMETMSMSGARGFKTGGTIHIVINNQIGFTTSNPIDTRSTPYCTDVAKMINAPIFHVNADDPEMVYAITQLAFEYRERFKQDVVLDLVCYRRHGHNEADEPAATQPRMYKVIKQLKTTRQNYAQWLIDQNVIAADEPNQRVKHYRTQLELGESIAPDIIEDGAKIDSQYFVDWRPFLKQSWLEPNTTISPSVLKGLAQKMCLHDNITPHPRVAKIYADRLKMAAGEKATDWGFAENLAYASLLHEGTPIRITGQDSNRGTFFHRHAAIHDVEDGRVHIPLKHLSVGQPNFEIIDSLLSEEAVLGFEYGYASADPNTLCIWEAQFGDFANGAQVVIDQFISSGEAKWGRLCGLALFLPHGYEGQGPEHSSARPERFFQLCADNNMQLLVPSTPAQVFHMIRRQVLRRARHPMIVMTPKSLLRHPKATSELSQLASGAFQTVIDETRSLDAQSVKRLVFCSGKVYYELLDTSEKAGLKDVAIIRVEQLYPFPYQACADIIQRYPNADTAVWCQEEPRNQGAWRSIKHRFERVISPQQNKILYRGRYSSASPAVGSAKVHAKQQAYLIETALGMSEWIEPETQIANT